MVCDTGSDEGITLRALGTIHTSPWADAACTCASAAWPIRAARDAGTCTTTRKGSGAYITKSGVPGTAKSPAWALVCNTQPSKGAVTLVKLCAKPLWRLAALAWSRCALALLNCASAVSSAAWLTKPLDCRPLVRSNCALALDKSASAWSTCAWLRCWPTEASRSSMVARSWPALTLSPALTKKVAKRPDACADTVLWRTGWTTPSKQVLAPACLMPTVAVGSAEGWACTPVVKHARVDASASDTIQRDGSVRKEDVGMWSIMVTPVYPIEYTRYPMGYASVACFQRVCGGCLADLDALAISKPQNSCSSTGQALSQWQPSHSRQPLLAFAVPWVNGLYAN